MLTGGHDLGEGAGFLGDLRPLQHPVHDLILQHQSAHMLATVALEHVDGGDQGAASRQHRINDQRHALVKLANKALEIGFRHQGLVIARNPYHAHLGARNQIQHTVKHAQPSAQNGYD